MKVKLLLLLSLLCFLISQSQTFNEGILEYTVTSESNVSVKRLGTKNITNAIIIPETVTNSGTTYTVTSIAKEGFKDYGGLQRVSIPNTVKSIGAAAFKNCSNITDIIIPEGVTTIEASTFEICYGLVNVSIPSTVTSIEDKAFYKCHRVSAYNLPAGLTSIGSYAFTDSQDITEIVIPSGVTTISEGDFDKCYKVESITLPSTLTTIEAYAFRFCKKVTELTIPEGVTTISKGAFDACYALNTITLPNTLTTINAYAFRDCQGITELTIPSSVTSIGTGALTGLWVLNTVNIGWTTPLVLSSDVFGGLWTGATTLNVPVGTATDYQNTYVWHDFKIKEEATLSIPNVNIEESIEVYPNPVQDVLSIQLNIGLELKEAKLYNNLGQLVKQSTLKRFNTSSLKSGLYILQIDTNQGFITKKILKK